MHVAMRTLTAANQSMQPEINSNLSEIESLFKVPHTEQAHTHAPQPYQTA